jgi:hypothetical protein
LEFPVSGAYTGLIVDTRDGIGAQLFGEAFPILLIVAITIYFAPYDVDTLIKNIMKYEENKCFRNLAQLLQ